MGSADKKIKVLNYIDSLPNKNFHKGFQKKINMKSYEEYFQSNQILIDDTKAALRNFVEDYATPTNDNKKKQETISYGTVYVNLNTICQFIAFAKIDFTKETLDQEFNQKIVSKFISLFTSKRNIQSHLKNFSRYLYQSKRISRENFERIKSLNYSNAKIADKKYSIPRNQWRETINIFHEPPKKMAIYLGLHFGLRRDEIVNLEWTDIKTDKIGSYIEINAKYDNKGNITWHPKTNGSKRKIPIAHEELQAINNYRSGWDKKNLKHNYVVYNPNNNKRAYYSNFSNWFVQKLIRKRINGKYVFHKKIMKTIMIEGVEKELSPHILRYSFATYMHDKLGTNKLKTIANFLGHASITTTENYLRDNEQAKRLQMHEAIIEASL